MQSPAFGKKPSDEHIIFVSHYIPQPPPVYDSRTVQDDSVLQDDILLSKEDENQICNLEESTQKAIPECLERKDTNSSKARKSRLSFSEYKSQKILESVSSQEQKENK